MTIEAEEQFFRAEFAKLRDEIKSAGLQIHASAHGALQQIKERPELQKFMQKQS